MDRIIKSGWVQKQSAYLKQWRKRWLVLREVSLSTHKTKDPNDTPTMFLLISDITEAVPSVLEIEKDFCFKIVCEDNYYITVESDKELCLWLNLINHTRLGRNVSLFDAPHYSRLSKATSDESLISSFIKVKEIIDQREEELQNFLKLTYEKYKIQAEAEHEMLSQSLSTEIENCKIVAESLLSEASVLKKIQQIQQLTKARQNFIPLDNINESQLKISMDQEVMSKIIRPNIKVSLKSVAQLVVRRTAITRALK